jgi:hypothetical protein
VQAFMVSADDSARLADILAQAAGSTVARMARQRRRWLWIIVLLGMAFVYLVWTNVR